MRQKRIYFFVGLFVIIGVMVGAAGIIWLGASKYFQKGSMYATYFDESVQGLQVDSIVKYRGVDVGTVRRISVASDQKLVEVVMKIDAADFSVDGVVAKLTLAGITGIVYVELDRKAPEEPSLVPKEFQPDYPVIPSSPSNIKQIEASINEVLKSIRQINFKGISDQVFKTAKDIDRFVNGERMNRIMRDAEATTARLASISEKIEKAVDDESIGEIVTGARDAIKDARTLISQIRKEIEDMKMGHTAGRINQFVEGTSRRVQSTLAEIDQTSETLRRTAESLETLANRLNVDPSALIFSSPPKGE
ncbi:MAG: Paraquat-inducible protein B [Syntrophorhabdaceae bacterium PtaU1.Bin034]|nr:MAG: Paraquat-inducible protein B [Syntrophorhabdaceae bacterium PtaU1.Bin034]